MTLFARILLALALILGASSASLPRPEAATCGCDPCPCGPAAPAPTSPRLPAQALAPVQTVTLEEESMAKVRDALAEGKPLDGIRLASAFQAPLLHFAPRGRDPDLGRHLARLRIFRI